MQSTTQNEDPNAGTEAGPQQDATQVGSGEGVASALARMKSQHDHRARQKPADDPSPGSHRDEKP